MTAWTLTTKAGRMRPMRFYTRLRDEAKPPKPQMLEVAFCDEAADTFDRALSALVGYTMRATFDQDKTPYLPRDVRLIALAGHDADVRFAGTVRVVNVNNDGDDIGQPYDAVVTRVEVYQPCSRFALKPLRR